MTCFYISVISVISVIIVESPETQSLLESTFFIKRGTCKYGFLCVQSSSNLCRAKRTRQNLRRVS